MPQNYRLQKPKSMTCVNRINDLFHKNSPYIWAQKSLQIRHSVFAGFVYFGNPIDLIRQNNLQGLFLCCISKHLVRLDDLIKFEVVSD